MALRGLIGALAIAALLGAGAAQAQGFDPAKYPDWKGQWLRTGRGNGNAWDPTKPLGRAQQPPLTPEYQARYEASLADQAIGGLGDDPTGRCIPHGMPRVMTVVYPMEVVILPQTNRREAEALRQRIVAELGPQSPITLSAVEITEPRQLAQVLAPFKA